MGPLISTIQCSAGNWYIITEFDKEVEAFIYDPEDPNKNPSSIRILVFPYKQGCIKLQFNEFVTDKETAKTATITDRNSPDFGKKKYTAYREFKTSGLIIGTRQERVWRLNKIEIHPAVVEVTTIDGASLEVIVQISIEVLDPILTKNVEDFLEYGAFFVTEILRLWCNNHTFKENRGIDTKDDFSKKDDIYDQIKILNDDDFVKNGFKVCKVAVIAVDVAERSLSFLNSEQMIGAAKNDVQISESTLAIELNQNKAQEARNVTKLAFLREQANIQKDLVKETSQYIVAQNEAWSKGTLKTLIMNSKDSNQLQTIQVADATKEN